jgi:hypothetical protein
VEADVVGLPITGSTVYYYDIYASELAALSTKKVNHCPEALAVAAKLEASEYISDPNIAADMSVVRTICSGDLAGSASSSAPTAGPTSVEATPTP